MKAETVHINHKRLCVFLCVCVLLILFFSVFVWQWVWDFSLWYLNEKGHSRPNTNSQYNTSLTTAYSLLLPQCFPHSLFHLLFLVPPSFFFSSLPLVLSLYCSLTSSQALLRPGCICVCVWLKFPDAAFLAEKGHEIGPLTSWPWKLTCTHAKRHQTYTTAAVYSASAPCEGLNVRGGNKVINVPLHQWMNDLCYEGLKAKQYIWFDCNVRSSVCACVWKCVHGGNEILDNVVTHNEYFSYKGIPIQLKQRARISKQKTLIKDGRSSFYFIWMWSNSC